MRKWLQSPIFVGIMACFAVLLLAKNLGFLSLDWLSGDEQKASQNQDEKAGKNAKGKSKEQAGSSQSSGDSGRATVDLANVGWVEKPERDPFRPAVLEPASSSETNDLPSAKEMLNLEGTWHQASGQLAIVNNRLVEEGDSVGEFNIEEIHPDGLWVTGPRGREWVGFKTGQSAATKNETNNADPEKSGKK